MAHIEIIDQTLRDGQQSLWGMKMRAAQILPIADDVQNAGYRVVDLTGSAILTVLTRQFRENPWETLDLITGAMPDAVLRAGTRPNATVGFSLTPLAVLDLFTRTLIRHGINSFWIFDCLFNMDLMERLAKVIHAEGAEVTPQIMYSLSDVHTDEFFADKAAHIAGWDHVDAIIIGDEPGVLTPERAATLIPAIKKAAGDIPLEMHCHNTTGLAPLNYMVAIDHGVTRLHTATQPLANGPSLPSTEQTLANIKRLGHTHGVDLDRLTRIREHVEFVARHEGYPIGVPEEFDLAHYDHQMPGGATGTLKSQLAQHGIEHRYDEVIEEVARVKAELGHPITATPFSQLIGIQAVLNIVTDDRYSVVPDEVVLYAMGLLGNIPAPMDPDVKDRILGSDRGRELDGWEPPQPSLGELRQEYGENLSDEELLLRILLPDADVDAMFAAGPVPTDYPTADEHPLITRLRELSTNAGDARRVDIKQGDLAIGLRR